MTKGRSQINNCAPPQPRLLRSRKREGPTDQSALPDYVEVTLPSQDNERSFKSVATKQPESLQPPVQVAVPDTNQDGKDDEEIQGCSSSVPQTSQEEEDGSCTTGLEGQQAAIEMNTNQVSEREEADNGCNGDDAAVSAPKKKRRMGMCAMTVKERSHILQNEAERVARQISNDPSGPVAEEETLSSVPSVPVHIQAATIPEQSHTETTPHSELCGGYDRAETKTCISPAPSDGINTVCDSRNSDGQSSQATPGLVPAAGLTRDPGTNPPAEREERLGSQEQKETKQSTTETTIEPNETGMKDEEDGSVGLNQHPDPAIFSLINQSQNEASEEQSHDGSLVTSLQVDSAARSGNSKMEIKGGGVEDVDGNEAEHGPTGPPSVSAGPGHPGDILDSFGSQCLDYVSDSQLNSVMFLDEEVVENDGCLGSSECDEDATHLICGLIRELSSVNRTVMVTYRQLENVRRGSKATKGLHRQRI